MTILPLVLGTSASAAGCASAIAEFEAIITSDAETGNLNKGVHRRIVAELASVKGEPWVSAITSPRRSASK